MALVAPLVGAWIEIVYHSDYSSGAGGRTPCGCVDRNCLISETLTKPCVAPLAGAWIEIRREEWYYCKFEVAPLVGAWIEIQN